MLAMAVLRGTVSLVVILLCTDLLGAVEKRSQIRIIVPESEHFCTKVMSGRFSHIQLVYIDLDDLYEPNYRMLSCQRVPKVSKNPRDLKYEYVTDAYSMTLNDTYDQWTNSVYGPIQHYFQDVKREHVQIRRFYFLPIGMKEELWPELENFIPVWPFVQFYHLLKHIFIVFTESALYTLDFGTLGQGSGVEQSKVTINNETSPEFALMVKYVNHIARGWVIQKDIYSHTGNFIIHDFKSTSNGSTIWSTLKYYLTYPYNKFIKRKLVKPEERKVYYFMEKTKNPHEIRLVHRDHAGANGSSADRQLLGGALPNGFHDNGSLYLFDGSLGCVYVVQHFEFNLTQQFEAGKVDIRLARLNIPYEQYFKCPDKYKLAHDFAQRHRADRCDSVIGEDDGSIKRVAPIEQSKSTGFSWTLIGLASLLLMAMLVVGMVIFWKKIKPREIGNKKRPIGPNDLESANKCNNTLITSGTTEASGTSTTTAVSSSADATVQSGTAK